MGFRITLFIIGLLIVIISTFTIFAGLGILTGSFFGDPLKSGTGWVFQGIIFLGIGLYYIIDNISFRQSLKKADDTAKGVKKR